MCRSLPLGKLLATPLFRSFSFFSASPPTCSILVRCWLVSSDSYIPSNELRFVLVIRAVFELDICLALGHLAVWYSVTISLCVGRSSIFAILRLSYLIWESQFPTRITRMLVQRSNWNMVIPCYKRTIQEWNTFWEPVAQERLSNEELFVPNVASATLEGPSGQLSSVDDTA